MGDETCFPPPAFVFSVAIVAEGAGARATVDGSFQEVSGLDSGFGGLEVGEGGTSRFLHRLPGVTRHSNLVLKRGLVTTESKLAKWLEETVGSALGAPIKTQTINVVLLGPSGRQEASWTFLDAWPVKWEVAARSASDTTKILTETLEFSYRKVTSTLTAPGG